MNGTFPRECLREARGSIVISLDFMLVFARIHVFSAGQAKVFQGRLK